MQHMVGDKAKNLQYGFTIIELLIVIVVIGILVTLVSVAYSGIQERAYNASITADARGWRQSLEAYGNAYGRLSVPGYPAPGGAYLSCLGDTSSYPSLTFDSISYTSNCTWPNPAFVKPELMTGIGTISKVSSGKKYDSLVTYTLNGNTSTKYYRRGIMYEAIINGSGGVQSSRIYYALKGENANCSLSGAINANAQTGSLCYVNLTFSVSP